MAAIARRRGWRLEAPSNLVTLTLSSCKNLSVYLEECEEMVPSNNQGEGDIQLPRLREVLIQYCPKLKEVPHYIVFSPTLKKLEMNDCPELGGSQPRLPPLLEYLELSGDVGVFSKSLPLVGPNLKSVRILFSPHSSLPKGFNQLTSIQSLGLYRCETLDFEREELKHLTMLQHLRIDYCRILRVRFGEGKDWRSTLSHVPKIIIDNNDITRSRN
ncbi:hypothetical protein IFM89_034780 [Coptis chinensis]|uniref:Disease resistance protein n=1 Tax=Coptis chinensis TaxID=261450 RepID=A0A835HAP5_9MAGN|nr:hypothetical protein IFM89_034780 [Coptis chinensis]